MKLVYQAINQLPALAWLVITDFKQGLLKAYGGKGIISRDNWLYEGAWAGDFEKSYFDKSDYSFGSGVRLEKDKVILSAPTTTLECVYYFILDNKTVLMSNSILALAIATGLKPKFDATNYLRIFESIRFGLDNYISKIPMEGGTINRFFYHNIEFQKGYAPKIIKRTKPEDFLNFQSYRDFLKQKLNLVSENALSSKRIIQYPLLCAISSGYDSPAIAVLAQEIGCKEAVSFKNAREQFDNLDDSGVEIAKYLNMPITTFDRLEYLNHDSRYETQFLSTGVGGEDIVFASFGNIVKHRCLLTGMVGDKVWGLNDSNIGLTIARDDNGGGSLGEYRLNADFIHIPAPYIGLLAQPSIHKISLSQDMKFWRIGGDYDRPIARRIIETAGIQRGSFGISKKAVSHSIGLPHTFSYKHLPEDVALSYQKFLIKKRLTSTLVSPQNPFRKFWLYAVTRLIWRKKMLPLWLKRIVNILERNVSLSELPQGDWRWLWHWSMLSYGKNYKSLRKNTQSILKNK